MKKDKIIILEHFHTENGLKHLGENAVTRLEDVKLFKENKLRKRIKKAVLEHASKLGW